jgi:3-oxoacyl-[acyl-carrier protein] reductase
MDLEGQVILITGAGSGLGRHLAQVFSEKKSNLVLLDISKTGLEKTVSSLKNFENHILDVLDVRKVEDWKYILGKVLLKWSRVDYLFNVAGYLEPGYINELSLEEIDKHIDINVKGVIYSSRIVSEVMVAQGSGHIVNIASLAGISPVPGLSLYSASKFAVRGFSLSIANELLEKGIYVTVVCPDAIRTPMLDLQANRKEARLTFSGKKVLEVEDVSKVILEEVIPKKPREVAIPLTRGLLAGFANLFPDLSAKLFPFFLEKGANNQQKYKHSNET